MHVEDFVGPSATAGLDGMLPAAQGADQQRVKMRAAPEKIQAVLADALASAMR